MMIIKSILYTLSLFLFFSYNSSTKKSVSTKSEELTKQETSIICAEKEIKDEQSIRNSDIDSNLIYADNQKFIVKIDRLKNEKIKYTSWSKPKTIYDAPDLELFNGVIDKQGTSGGYHYTFKNGDWKYIVENNLTGETEKSMGIFLRLIYKNEDKLYTKLEEQTERIPNKEVYIKTDLIGMWWTPNYAIRKINFFKNGRFKFNEDDDNYFNGKYIFANHEVTLVFDSLKNNIVMEIGGGNDGYSYTLIGEGENFVKEWEE